MATTRLLLHIATIVGAGVILPACQERGVRPGAAAGYTAEDRFTPVDGRSLSPAGAADTIIGLHDEREGHLLSHVTGAVEIGPDRLVVADGGSNEIRAFDRTGHLLWRVGGTGGGPEMFGALQGVWRGSRGSILAYDVLSQRVSFWNANGAFLRTLDLRGTRRLAFAGQLEDESLIAVDYDKGRAVPPGTVRMDSLTILRISGDSVISLGRFPDRAIFAYAVPGRTGTLYTSRQFEPQGIVSVGHSDIYFGFSNRWSITRIDPLTGKQTPMTIDLHRLPLTREIIDAFVDERVARASIIDRPAVRREYVRREYPDSLPTFDRLQLASNGRILLREFATLSAQQANWRLLDSAGRVIATIRLSRDTEILDVLEDHAIALVRGGNDVEMIATIGLRQ